MINQFTAPSQIGPLAGSVTRLPGRQSRPGQNWQAIAQMARMSTGLRTGLRFNQGLLAALKEQGFTPLERPHPFKIYNVPTVCLSTVTPATDWLRYRVRTGMVGDLDVDGTDEVADPDSDEVPTDGTGDITVTSGEDQFFFWIELSKPSGVFTATIKYGDPLTNGWADYPDTDGRFILIGWVDTTDTTHKQGKVRQILRTDILQGIDTIDCAGGSSRDVQYDGYSFDS
jgi:hypothetical protein